MQDTISFTNALWLAGIAPTLGFMGIIVTLIVNARMARSQAREEADRTRQQLHGESERSQLDRNAERNLERDRLLRQERVGAYREVIAASGAVLMDSMQRKSGTAARSDPLNGSAVRATWAEALAGVQLVGAAEVVTAAEGVDFKSQERYRPSTEELMAMMHTQIADEEATPAARMATLDAGLQLIIEGTEENKTLHLALVGACRRSLAATEETK